MIFYSSYYLYFISFVLKAYRQGPGLDTKIIQNQIYTGIIGYVNTGMNLRANGFNSTPNWMMCRSGLFPILHIPCF